mmetsp:Transcript_3066/g.8373  ORF Transcript_3066/g.8373 Transcript_3066/m.8373 type:complete len:429 (-) Transcript_3066:75-1361(-)
MARGVRLEKRYGSKESETRSGAVPNVYWRSPTFHELRMDKMFRGLPPSSWLRLESEACAPYFRQESDEWAACHSGRITTSSLPGCLGLNEKKASGALKLPKGFASHRHALHAYHLVQEEVFLVSGSASKEVLTFNAKQVEEYNAGLCLNGSEDEGEEDRREERCKQVAKMGVMAVHCAWGISQEPAALFSLLRNFVDSEVLEVGLCPLSFRDIPYEWGINKKLLPPMGASPDALLVIPLSKLDDETTLEGRLASFLPRGWEGGDEWRRKGHLCCVVEVKSVSPFREIHKVTKSGKKKKLRYRLIDAEPRDRVNVMHVPQLQMHMLCTGAPIALYVSYSAGNGIALYVMKADKFYQKSMLRWVSLFQKEYVAKKSPPPENFFWEMEAYQNFLGHTRKIARTATLFETLPPTVMDKYAKSAPFLSPQQPA